MSVALDEGNSLGEAAETRLECLCSDWRKWRLKAGFLSLQHYLFGRAVPVGLYFLAEDYTALK